MKHLLESTSPLLYIEIDKGSLTAAQASFEEIPTILRQAGYSAFLPVIRRRIGGSTLVFQDVNSVGRKSITSLFDITALKSDAIERWLS
jgi:hypothetical protein